MSAEASPDGAPSTTRTQATVWFGAAVVFGLNLALKARDLGNASLWLDEAVAVHIAQRNLPGILRASQADTTPPVYYLLLGVFERAFGIGEAAARWPSVTASALAAAALFLFAHRTLGRFAAWFASLLFLLSDVNLFFAREARPYTLAVLLTILSFTAFFSFRERPSWFGASVLAALNLVLVLTHYLTIFVPATQVLALLFSRREQGSIRRFLTTSVPAAAVTALFMVPVLASNQPAKMGWLKGPTSRIGRMLGWYSGGMRWPGIFFILLAGTLAALYGARRRREGPVPSAVWTFALWGLAPIAVAFVISFTWPCLHARYLLYCTPGLILFWTAGIMALRTGWPRLLGAAVVCALTAAGLGKNFKPRADWRSAAAFARAARADRVLLVPEWEAPTLAYYLHPAAFRDPDRTNQSLEANGVRLLSPGNDSRELDLADARVLVLIDGAPARTGAGDRIRHALANQGFLPGEERGWPGLSAMRFQRDAAQPGH
jgi:mannosyltransferase